MRSPKQVAAEHKRACDEMEILTQRGRRLAHLLVFHRLSLPNEAAPALRFRSGQALCGFQRLGNHER